MKYQTLLVEINHSIGIVWMNRPKLHNALDETMISELIEAMRTLNDDPAVRAVILAGAGGSFCAGGGLKWMERMAGCPFEQNHADAMNFGTLLATIDAMQKPTIARVHGPVFAGGVGLVAACDIAVADYAAEFCLSEVRLGLIPSTIGPYVVRAMGERAARRYFLSAELFTAAEAYRIGLVSEIAPPDELDARINELLGQLIQGGPVAQALSKEWIRAVAGVPITPDLIIESAKHLAAVRASEEGREGIRSFIEKRKPAWLGNKKKPTAKKAAAPKAKRRKK
ncbi:MAG: enoyl-CoA hydratase/isomerase family protein [Syntrophales bacterium]|nr:enoyl-CoA hydratase/isomerase family protein [Syntrophales bacterium]